MRCSLLLCSVMKRLKTNQIPSSKKAKNNNNKSVLKFNLVRLLLVILQSKSLFLCVYMTGRLKAISFLSGDCIGKEVDSLPEGGRQLCRKEDLNGR